MSTTIPHQQTAARAGDEVPEVLCLIDGRWVRGGGEVKDTVNPATGEVVSRVPFATPQQVEQAVAAAQAAQRAWAAVPIAERARILSAGLDAVEARAEEICQWISLEMGKTINEARAEVIHDIVLPVGRAIIEDARRLSGNVPSAWNALYPRRRVQVIHQPLGVTAFISPWNFPAEMSGGCVGALMMGNACVWKPSEWAPTGPRILVEALVSAGLPEGLINLVYGGPEVGEHLVTRDEVMAVGFIGSTAVGEEIARAAGVKRLLLELGGNGPMIVLEDADLDKAVEAAFIGCFFQAGQVCTAAERILVHESLHDEFAERLSAMARGLTVGDPLAEDTEMGPLSDQRILDKVVRHVEQARQAGATVLTGGQHHGLFYEPTVLTGVTPDMEIAREETFGPVAPILKISSAEEALAIANDSEYGLSMSVFTNDLTTAFDMAEGLEAGAVNVNTGTNDWELNGPFGGWKKSGIGRLPGEELLRTLTNTKTITFDLG